MVDFLFTYQHKAREIESLVLISSELERRGYSVEFCCTFSEHRLGFSKGRKPRVAVASALYDNGTLGFFVYDVCGHCRKVVDMQWEQVLSKDEEQDPKGFHNPKECAKEAVHLCWGKATSERLVCNGVSSDKAVITGPVQMDFLRPEFKNYFFDKQELAFRYSIDPDRKWNLFISSFTLANMSKEEFADIVACVGDEALVMKKISAVSKHTALGWFEEVLKAYPEIELIYRPHPDESEDEALYALKKKYPNFFIINELTVKQWALCCDKIYTWYSTSIADIYFSGKSCEILRPIEIPEKYEMSIYDNGRFIETKEKFLESYTKTGNDFPLNSALIESYFDHNPIIPSYIRVCDMLEKVYRDSYYNMRIPIRVKIMDLVHRCYLNFMDYWSKRNYNKVFFFSKEIIRRISHYKASMIRVDKDRSKNLATEEEIRCIKEKIRNCLSGRTDACKVQEFISE